MNGGNQSAQEITRASGSNLALAFFVLPAERRPDAEIFYAFCRVIDDLADDPELSPETKAQQLEMWRRALEGQVENEPALAGQLRGVIEKHAIPREHLREIVAGVEMDLSPRRYETFEDLRVYCNRVAGAVGLVSIEIFGYSNVSCRRFALDLGMALQITNILRDVGQDFENGGRVYLPLEDLRRCGYSEADLSARIHNEAFLRLMRHEAQRARLFFHSAFAHLAPEDRRAMLPATIMAAIYARLLERMERDGFRVFEKRYALGRWEKTAVVAGVLLRGLIARLRQPTGNAPAN